MLAFSARVDSDAAKGEIVSPAAVVHLSQLRKERAVGTFTRFLGSVVSGTSDSLDGTAILAKQAALDPGADRGWNVRSCLPDLRLRIRNGVASPRAPRSTRSSDQDSASRRYERRGSARAVGAVRGTLRAGGYFHRATDLHLLPRLFEPVPTERGRIPHSSGAQAVDGGCISGDTGAAPGRDVRQIYPDEV